MEHLDHEILDQYHKGDATPAMREKAEVHLNSCRECKELFDRWQVFQKAIRDREMPQSSERFVFDIMKRVTPCERQPFSFTVSSFLRNWGFQSLATACSLLLIFSYSIGSQSLDTNALALASSESEILSYGYSEETFQLSNVLGFSDLEDLQ